MKNFIYILALIFLASCSSTKNIDNRPSWVKQRPLSELNYVGIGSASKITSPNNYTEVAKDNALSDIASEISVNISAISVLNTIETSSDFNEEFSSVIKSKAAENLQDYKMIASYEGEEEYWVYYMLNKSDYNRRQQRLKEVTLNKSKDYYLKSIEFFNNHDIKNSLDFLFKALVNMKEYWNEDTEVLINEKKVYLGNEIVRHIGENLNHLRIQSVHNNIDAKIGKSISGDQLSFRVVDSDGVGQRDIPVLFSYSENRIVNNRVKSNSEGELSYYLPKVSTKSSYSTFSAEIDIRDIIESASRDYLLVKLYSSIENPKVVVSVNNKYPTFYLDIKEHILSKNQNTKVITDFVKTQLLNKGVELASNKKDADFVMKISCDTKKIAKNDLGIYTSELSGDIDIFSNDIQVFSTKLTKQKGRGNDYKKASLNAYDNTLKELESKVVYQIISELF